jgi:hypothetical protein
MGLALGLGIWLVLGYLRRRRGPTLDQRLAPYLRGIRPPGDAPGADPRADPRAWEGYRRRVAPSAREVLAPVMTGAVRWVERVSGGGGQVARRLDELGDGSSVSSSGPSRLSAESSAPSPVPASAC